MSVLETTTVVFAVHCYWHGSLEQQSDREGSEADRIGVSAVF